MKKFKGKTFEEYKMYAQKRRSKSKICTIMDKEIKAYRNRYNDVPLLNGSIMSDSANNPYLYMCTIGDGFVEDGKTYMTGNYYTIYMYSGVKGVTIYKALSKSINQRCFVCGNSPEIFGYNHFSAGCRVYEEMEVSEVVTKLCNKNWMEYYNVQKNKPNIMFLKQMKQRLIKILEYNKIIYQKQNGKYEDYKYYGLIK